MLAIEMARGAGGWGRKTHTRTFGRPCHPNLCYTHSMITTTRIPNPLHLMTNLSGLSEKHIPVSDKRTMKHHILISLLHAIHLILNRNFYAALPASVDVPVPPPPSQSEANGRRRNNHISPRGRKPLPPYGGAPYPPPPVSILCLYLLEISAVFRSLEALSRRAAIRSSYAA